MTKSRRIVLKSALGLTAAAAGGLFAWQHSVLNDVRPTEAVPALRPFQKSVRVQNIDAHVIDAGSGPPVLLFHGIPDTSDLWAGTIEALRATHRCIAFDMPGFGNSHAVRGAFDWSLQNRADFVAGILDALGVNEPVRIIAHDAGGVWAGVFCGAYPERIERALFSITSIHPSFEWRDGAKLNRMPVLGELAMTAFSEKAFVKAVTSFSGPKRSEQSIREVYQRVDGRMRRAVLSFYRTTEVSEFTHWHPLYLAALKDKPVRVIWGALNPAATPEDGVMSFPTDDLIVYPEVGHWPMLEEPEQWSADVVSFLARPVQ